MYSVVLVFVFCVFIQGGVGASCEAGWKKNPDSNTCLKFFPAKQSWINSRNSCLRQGSILVTVHSQASNNFITKNITGGIRTWTGLRTKGSHGNWKWESVASPVDYYNWAAGEPNNHLSPIFGSEECVEIEDSSGEWNDESCDSLRAYVCQKNLGCETSKLAEYSGNDTLLNTGEQVLTETACMTGYRPDVDFINATCQADSRWAFDAYQCEDIYCRDPSSTRLHNGKLYIEPADAPYAVGAKIRYQCNIGFTLHGNEVSSCRDIDMAIPFGVWDQPPICLKSPKCEEGWASHNNYCYQFVEQYLEWHDADQHCQLIGGPWSRLVAITTEGENRMIRELTNTTERIWIGLHDVPSEGIWEWTDNSAVAYKNWAPGEPNNGLSIFGNEDCVEADQSTGEWNDEDCDARRMFVCEKFIAN